MLSLEKIYDAEKTLKGVVYQTDVINGSRLSEDYQLYLKTENLQRAGSFKLRGAYYKISRLTEEERRHGVIACSAGNHAQGVALAATQNNIKSIICLPAGASVSKVEATKKYGAEVCMVNGVFDDAFNRALELQKEHGYTFIHPFNDEDVIAGQATVGLEILRQLENVEAIVVPIGGGGLISGIAFAVKSLKPSVKIYGVQADGAPSMRDSIRDGKIEKLSAMSTIADGIAIKQPGDLTYDLCKKYVDEIVTVTDEEIACAILALIEKEKIVAEGAGAAALAAVLSGKLPQLKGKTTCVVISGGNIDVTILSRVIDRALKVSGRKCTLSIDMQDRPGELGAVSDIIAAKGANVTNVYHEHGAGNSILGCRVRFEIETRDHAHIVAIREAIRKAGYTLV